MCVRILRGSLVVLIVFPVCYYAWFWAWLHGLPPDFGMPEREEELELAMRVGSGAFLVVPLFISIRVRSRLNRIFPASRQESHDLIP